MNDRTERREPQPLPDFGQQIIDLGGVNAAWSLFLAAVAFAVVIGLLYR